jgi:hypothetical protein
MKLNEDSLIFRIDDTKFVQDNCDRLCKQYEIQSGDSERQFDNEQAKFYLERGYRKLVFSGKSKSNLENYKVSKEIRIDVLKTLPNRTDIIMVDENTCIKYKKTDDNLRVCQYLIQNIDNVRYIRTQYFEVDFLSGEILGYDYNDEVKQVVDEVYSQFMVIVTYLELTPITLMIINGGDKRGDIIRDNFIKNETRSSVIQVNSNWNVKTVRLGGFDVRGHYRLMLVGKGRTRYEYVFVKPYKKGILRRLPQKMTIEPMTVEQLN